MITRYAAAAIEVDAAPREVFELVTDWPRHHEWMFMTTAEQVAADRIEAYTGIRPFGFLDPMTITRWEPPHVVVMAHTGSLVRGDGAIRVRERPGGSRVIWAERLLIPVWAAPLWPVAHEVSVALARHSLRRLAALLNRPL
ncbi:SRPBCC family protein [Nonomuraea sp. NBC_01738]|uniref:SRPBCC family protein n=1 Tax=Nonomuraea sp. NBC_01738 TaxID=2976003 RepID=UPI002E0F3A8F|nr:SRPBCC family protein [Nonomuraea sp. NBC_01738]